MRKSDRKCDAPGCGKKHHSKGYCAKHYQQVKVHGEVQEQTRESPNKIVIKEKYAIIYLRNNEGETIAKAKISLRDVDRVRGYKWGLSDTSRGEDSYVSGYKIGLLHRFIMGVSSDADKNITVDHRNNNRLDCRRKNLRVCKDVQNAKNRKVGKNKSGVKGIYWHKHTEKWCGSIMSDKKVIQLGYFHSLIRAARAYNKKAKELHGEFAKLNSIKKLKERIEKGELNEFCPSS